MGTHEQSGVRQILKVCKERARVCAMNTSLQNSVTNNNWLEQSIQNLTLLNFKV